MEKLRSIKFPGYSNYASVNDAYQDFVTKFLFVIDFFATVKTLRVKSNTKTCSDVDVINAIRNRDKHYKKLKRSDKEIDKGSFKCTKLLRKKIIKNFEKKITEKIIILKDSETSKSLGMPAKGGRQSKISLKKNDVVSLNSKDNANTFYRFFSNLVHHLCINLHVQKINLESKLLKR